MRREEEEGTLRGFMLENWGGEGRCAGLEGAVELGKYRLAMSIVCAATTIDAR